LGVDLEILVRVVASGFGAIVGLAGVAFIFYGYTTSNFGLHQDGWNLVLLGFISTFVGNLPEILEKIPELLA
jgi:hypothetical protein